DEVGEMMSIERWTNPSHRTLQYVATSIPDGEDVNRVLLIVHGDESPAEVVLPRIDGVVRFVSLWSSADEHPAPAGPDFAPGDAVHTPGTSMRLLRAEQDP